MTTISYQPVGSGKTAIYPTAIQSPVAQYQYKYNSNNQLAAVIDELGNRSSLVWDSFGNRTAVDRPVQPTDQLCLRFDGAARGRAKRAGPAGDAGLRQPGPAEPPTSIRSAFEHHMRMTPTASSCACRTRLGHITTTLHDSVNRLTARIDPLGNRVSYTYDVDGRLIRTTNPIGAITTQVFDANSRLIATIDPLGLRNSYAYDVSSNLIRT